MLLVLLVFALSLGSCHIEAQLSVDFYKNTCPNVQTIIKQEVKKAFLKNMGIAAGIIRMNFHDCFVRGCDASILIKSTPGNSAEEDGPPNAGSLRGREAIDSAKARLEQDPKCKGQVSCADILAYAARDAVVITGGLSWDVPAGRRDGRISRAEDTFSLPAPFSNLPEITQAFANKNMSQDEMIALLGAHTIGRSHCTSFSDRLYNFRSTNQQDPTLDRSYAFSLKLQCPRRGPQGNVDPNSVVSMNRSPFIFDNSYYTDVQRKRGLFTSDQTLTTTEESLSDVQEYADSNKKWLQDFADAMIKMNQIEVLTGTAGEIRLNCGVINP